MFGGHMGNSLLQGLSGFCYATKEKKNDEQCFFSVDVFGIFSLSIFFRYEGVLLGFMSVERDQEVDKLKLHFVSNEVHIEIAAPAYDKVSRQKPHRDSRLQTKCYIEHI